MDFLSDSEIRTLAEKVSTPLFVYDEKGILESVKEALSFPNPYGLTVRFAMKSLPNQSILRLMDDEGVHFDASSEWEVKRALQCGIQADKIQLTAQELASDLKELVEKGISFNACSLRQLEAYGKIFPGKNVSVRINPGLGSGHSNRTNVGGPSSSFGIWWEHISMVKEVAQKYDLTITKLHTHIGSGSDPEVWNRVASMSLGIAKEFPEVETFNLGGGFKVARMAGENSANLHGCGEAISREFIKFYEETGRQLKLEIEPGTFLVALHGALVAKIQDIVSTNQDYCFYKVDSGMTEVTRPCLYGAQHPIRVVFAEPNKKETEKEQVIVAGHCCESGDILTPEESNPEGLMPRFLVKAQVGDFLLVDGVGAYCAGMSLKNYNSFPEAPEVMKKEKGGFTLIRKRQTLEQMLVNECSDPLA